VKIYWKVRKDFLDYKKHSISHDSLTASKISARIPTKNTCSRKTSSLSILSNPEKILKVLE
jgi:hypothetical protein